MTPALVRLPAAMLVDGACEQLAACARAVGAGRTVVVGQQRTTDGHPLDEFVVATAIAARAPGVAIGVATRARGGRHASVIAREATTAQLLGACDVLVLDGDAAACADAAAIITALFTAGEHTLARGAERIDHARNVPLPDVEGGPGIVWRDGDALCTLVDGVPARCGIVEMVAPGEPLPAPDPRTLVELEHPVALAADLAASLSA